MTKQIPSAPIDINPMPERPSKPSNAYEKFRPNVIIDQVTAYLEKYREPGYVYKGVIMNYKHLPLNVINHEKVGYEIVYSTHQFSDDRTFAPDSAKHDSSVPKPVIKSTSDGYQYLLMRISTDKFKKFKEDEERTFQDKYKRSVKSISKSKDGVLRADGGFINSNNLGDE